MYGESDTFGSFTLNKTSIDEFKAAFGNRPRSWKPPI